MAAYKPIPFGTVFGRLTVIGASDRRTRAGIHVQCQCECGQSKTIASQHLRNGHTKSCGCGQPIAARLANTTHGRRNTAEFNVWSGMHQRCGNPNNKSYKYYGGRGIYVCDCWKRFENFMADVGARPSPSHTIDRIDNDGPYAPGNVRWALRSAQNQNTRRNRIFTLDGKTMCLADWARLIRVSSNTARRRLVAAGATINVVSSERP